MKKQTKPKEAVIYTRFSTDTQTSNSTEYQLEHCREFCKQTAIRSLMNISTKVIVVALPTGPSFSVCFVMQKRLIHGVRL